MKFHSGQCQNSQRMHLAILSGQSRGELFTLHMPLVVAWLGVHTWAHFPNMSFNQTPVSYFVLKCWVSAQQGHIGLLWAYICCFACWAAGPGKLWQVSLAALRAEVSCRPQGHCPAIESNSRPWGSCIDPAPVLQMSTCQCLNFSDAVVWFSCVFSVFFFFGVCFL